MMNKIKNFKELQKLRDTTSMTMGMRTAMPDNIWIEIQMEECGIKAGAKEVVTAFCEAVSKHKLVNVTVAQGVCGGICDNEPVVKISAPGKKDVTYVRVTPDRVAQIVSEHVVGGTPVSDFKVKGES
jgi:NADP-reducing hydrogenase subunit HndB